jgi:hypothetical protein
MAAVSKRALILTGSLTLLALTVGSVRAEDGPSTAEIVKALVNRGCGRPHSPLF